MALKQRLQDFAAWYSKLAPSRQLILWGIYGAIAWGGLMTIFFISFEWFNNEPLHTWYTALISIVCGFGWGVLMWRSRRLKRLHSSDNSG